ncbi:hypothetical protein SDC9_163491 [bioreactor metagenome]|uniref:Uncharacterized protein n=1 Tax=bioreactor metagenome TaxID=1076179 RepID=A0A645FVQ2_9ZZZZ
MREPELFRALDDLSRAVFIRLGKKRGIHHRDVIIRCERVQSAQMIAVAMGDEHRVDLSHAKRVEPRQKLRGGIL